MANPTTRKRIGPTAGTGSEVTVYTVPASTLSRITQIHFANSNTIGVSDQAQATIGAGAAGTAICPLTNVVPGGGVQDYYGAPTGYIMAAAETLRIKCTSNVSYIITYEETTLG